MTVFARFMAGLQLSHRYLPTSLHQQSVASILSAEIDLPGAGVVHFLLKADLSANEALAPFEHDPHTRVGDRFPNNHQLGLFLEGAVHEPPDQDRFPRAGGAGHQDPRKIPYLVEELFVNRPDEKL